MTILKVIVYATSNQDSSVEKVNKDVQDVVTAITTMFCIAGDKVSVAMHTESATALKVEVI